MTNRWRLSPRELLLIFVFWTSLATLTAVNRLSDPRGLGFRLGSPTGRSPWLTSSRAVAVVTPASSG